MILALLLPTVAMAADLHLGAELIGDVPVDLGARATLEVPGRVQFSTAMGYMPPGDVRTINKIIMALGGYDQDTADLIEEALTSSLVWRTHVGWRPFRKAGFYLEGGYGLIALGGSLGSGTLIAEAYGIRLPSWLTEGYDFTIESSLHQADLQLGWQGHIYKRLTWRFGLGWSYTVAAKTEIAPTFEPFFLIEDQVDDFCTDAEVKLDTIYTDFFHPPAVTLGVGWEFF